MNRSEGYRRQSHDTREAARAHLRQLREARLARRGPGHAPPAARADDAEPEGALAPRISVSRAASEAISEWSRRETGRRDPDEGAAQAAPPPPVGPEEGPAPDSPMSAPLGADGDDEGAGDATSASGGTAPERDAPGGRAVPADPPVAAADAERPASAGPDSPAAQAGSGAAAGAQPASGTAAEEPSADGAVEASPDPGAPPRHTPAPDVDADPRTASIAESDLHALPGAGIGLVWMLQRCGVSSLADLAAEDPERLRRDMGLVGELLDLSSWIDFARSAAEDAPPAAR